MESMGENNNFPEPNDAWQNGPYFGRLAHAPSDLDHSNQGESEIQETQGADRIIYEYSLDPQLDPALLDTTTPREDSDGGDSNYESPMSSDGRTTDFSDDETNSRLSTEEFDLDDLSLDHPALPSTSEFSRRNVTANARKRGRPRGRAHPEGVKRKGELHIPTSANPNNRHSSRGGRRGRRGPNKVAEPDPEFKKFQSEATTLFLKGDYAEALKYAQNAVRSNPEIFAAHSLLSEIYLCMGRSTESALALFTGAHTRRDPQIWWQVAGRILNLKDVDREEILQRAFYCYVMILKYDKEDYSARKEKVSILMENGAKGKARFDCEVMLKYRPDDVETLRLHTILSKDLNEEQKGIDVFDSCIIYFAETNAEIAFPFKREIINLYLSLFEKAKRPESGLLQAKKLARSLLGRSSETYWDDINDDREWDLEDRPRRIGVSFFRDSQFSVSQYGEGLPPEIRTRMGIFRLSLGGHHFNEAWNHFQILMSSEKSIKLMVEDFPEILRESADLLKSQQHFEEALLFYDILRSHGREVTSSLYLSIAACHHGLKQVENSIGCLKGLINDDPENIEARIQLARVYEENGRTEEATTVAREVLGMKKFEQLKSAQERAELQANNQDIPARAPGRDASKPHTSNGKRRTSRRLGGHPGMKRAHQSRREKVKTWYNQLAALRPDVIKKKNDIVLHWMAIARLLMLEFQQNREFFPSRDKQHYYLGLHTQKPIIGRNFAEMTELARRDGFNEIQNNEDNTISEFLDVHFDEWLEVYCQFSYLAAERGQEKDCWQSLETASNANVFVLHENRSNLLQSCILACSQILNSELHTCRAWRWFVKKQPFSSDVFRLYGILNRYHTGPKRFYNDGPSQKFIMRQIKAADFALLPKELRKTYNFTEQEQSSLTSGGTHDGNPHGLLEHDPALFALHAHCLASGGAYPGALNYYFRAYSITPNDPVLNLCIGLCYVQHAMKRMSENRQYQIHQGLSFLARYSSLRSSSNSAVELQEAKFNLGRVWHMLGLLHLALPAYNECLELSTLIQETGNGMGIGMKRSEIAAEAAFTMQSIYTLSGDPERAKLLTHTFLTLE